MTVQELINIYENIYEISVRDLYRVHVLYCAISSRKTLQNYNPKDIEDYCKFTYLLQESKKLKDELEVITSYGRNKELLTVLDKVTNIYENSSIEVERLAKIINCYEHKVEPIKDGIEDLFE